MTHFQSRARSQKSPLACLSLLLLVILANPLRGPQSDSTASAATIPSAASRTHTAEEQIRQADRQFCIDTRKDGLEGWLKWFSKSVSLGGLSEPVKGESALREHYRGQFGPGFISLVWDPREARVFPDGHLGYTTGRYRWHSKDSGGEDQFSTGSYLTVWKLETDGAWRVISDFGSPDPKE